MPNQIEQLEGGKIRAKLETGEIFEGDALEITQKMADAHVSTKKWGQEWKAKAEVKPPEPATPPPPVDQNEAQLQAYLLAQHAKALGYDSADAYKAEVMRVKATSEAMQNKMAAADFMQMAPDFPNTPAAIDALAKKVDEMGWEFSPKDMLAAHAVLVREHASDPTKGYEALTIEQQNASWEHSLRESNKRPTPPPVISSKSPDGDTKDNDPYKMDLDELRKQVIRQQLGEK